jgi:ribosome-binding protein aMBF1 (putative translation factor)
MNKCEMAGCVDMADLAAEIDGETLDLCASCADYLRGYFIGLGNKKQIKITKHANKERELSK